MEPTKLCKDCGENLPLSMFHKHKTTLLGVNSYCKQCACIRASVWQTINKKKANEKNSAWRKLNRAYCNDQYYKYIGKKTRATPSWANDFFISEAYSLAILRNKVCGGVWHVDHIVPLSSNMVCGLHSHDNLQVIRSEVNRAKSNKHWPDMP